MRAGAPAGTAPAQSEALLLWHSTRTALRLCGKLPTTPMAVSWAVDADASRAGEGHLTGPSAKLLRTNSSVRAALLDEKKDGRDHCQPAQVPAYFARDAAGALWRIRALARRLCVRAGLSECDAGAGAARGNSRAAIRASTLQAMACPTTDRELRSDATISHAMSCCRRRRSPHSSCRCARRWRSGRLFPRRRSNTR